MSGAPSGPAQKISTRVESAPHMEPKGTVFTIVVEPTFLRASVWLLDGERTMYVYRSPVVQDTDSCMAPVYDYLNEVCFRTISSRPIDDQEMMFGQAQLTAHQIMMSCPGQAVNHICRIQKTERSEVAT